MAGGPGDEKAAQWTREEYRAHLVAAQARQKDEAMARDLVAHAQRLDYQTRGGKIDWKEALIGDWKSLAWVVLLLAASAIGWRVM